MDGLASEANLVEGGTLTPKLRVELIEPAVGRDLYAAANQASAGIATAEITRANPREDATSVLLSSRAVVTSD